jgi:hypothetical protein
VSIQGEQELRSRLGGLLDDIEPSPAPVARTVRRGRGLRRRRLAGAAAGVAVIVAAAALLPGLLRPASRVSPSEQLHYKITVQRPNRGWASGTIAAGVTDGRPWKFVASGTHDFPVISVRGRVGMSQFDNEWSRPAPASLLSETGSGHPGFVEIFGTVSPSVTRLVVDLRGGTAVTLKPVASKAKRWVGLIIPSGVPVVRAIAYSGDRELAYAVPFHAIELNVWWPAGQTGPARVTKVIGSGVVSGLAWHVTAEIGPWGYCYVYQNGSVCEDSRSSPEVVPTSKVVAYMSCGPIKDSTAPYLGIAAARTSVRTVVISFSDGSSASFHTVLVSGGRVFAYVVPKHVSVTGTHEYGAAGQLVGSSADAPGPC